MKKIKLILAAVLFLAPALPQVLPFRKDLGWAVGFAQNQNVGIGTTAPVPSAMLEVVSSNKGVLVPRMNTLQMNAIASPANGLLNI